MGDVAAEFDALFGAVYLTFHRRDAPRSQLSGPSLAVLQHLAVTGPVTVGELTLHLRRAQSVISEIVRHLERDGLLERQQDPADGRRAFVWLSERGRAELDAAHRVLGREELAEALRGLEPDQTASLLRGLRELLAHAPPVPTGLPPHPHEHSQEERTP